MFQSIEICHSIRLLFNRKRMIPRNNPKRLKIQSIRIVCIKRRWVAAKNTELFSTIFYRLPHMSSLQIREAMQCMSDRKNVGKVLLSPLKAPPEPEPKPEPKKAKEPEKKEEKVSKEMEMKRRGSDLTSSTTTATFSRFLNNLIG